MQELIQLKFDRQYNTLLILKVIDYICYICYVPRLDSSEEENEVEVMRRDTNCPNASPINVFLVTNFLSSILLPWQEIINPFVMPGKILAN